MMLCLIICAAILPEHSFQNRTAGLYEQLREIALSIEQLEKSHIQVMLEEVEIVGDQAKRLEHLIESLAKEDASLRFDLEMIVAGRKPKERQALVVKKIKEIPRKLEEGFEEILLSHQRKRMEQALVQRTIYSLKKDIQPFQIPLLFASDLDLSESEKTALEVATKKAKAEFALERRKHGIKAWDAIIARLNEHQVSQIEEFAGNVRKQIMDGRAK